MSGGIKLEKELISKIFTKKNYSNKNNMEEHIKEYIKKLKMEYPTAIITKEFYKGENILVIATLVENKTNNIKKANEKNKGREDDWYIRQRGER